VGNIRVPGEKKNLDGRTGNREFVYGRREKRSGQYAGLSERKKAMRRGQSEDQDQEERQVFPLGRRTPQDEFVMKSGLRLKKESRSREPEGGKWAESLSKNKALLR